MTERERQMQAGAAQQRWHEALSRCGWTQRDYDKADAAGRIVAAWCMALVLLMVLLAVL